MERRGGFPPRYDPNSLHSATDAPPDVATLREFQQHSKISDEVFQMIHGLPVEVQKHIVTQFKPADPRKDNFDKLFLAFARRAMVEKGHGASMSLIPRESEFRHLSDPGAARAPQQQSSDHGLGDSPFCPQSRVDPGNPFGGSAANDPFGSSFEDGNVLPPPQRGASAGGPAGDAVLTGEDGAAQHPVVEKKPWIRPVSIVDADERTAWIEGMGIELEEGEKLLKPLSANLQLFVMTDFKIDPDREQDDPPFEQLQE